ncbi:hypothetical protein KRP22_000244 [Phytophthora ramorum]|nr:Cilia- and flagella-associated protein 91 [Phytophthora ramorum]
MSRTAPSRALDPVYDTVYTVSNSGGSFRKGVYRASSKPASTVSSIGNQNPAEGNELVSGSQRVKFHRRPVLPHLQTEPPEVLLAPVYAASAPPVKHRDTKLSTPSHVAADVVNGNTRSVGIQTVYRESEAQTDPYTPDYTVQKTATGLAPEIATLAGLSHARGQLPVGQAELELMERNRKKRAFEASLPPMTDEASFLLRKAMLEAQETREWAFREAEIDAFHDQRVVLLEQALAEREKETAFLSEQRLEALRQRLLHEKENALESIQQERVTALRKLTKKRAQRQQERGFGASRPERGRDIIAEYANFGSQVYAPVTRDGKAGKIEVRELGIGKAQFLQLDALRELESALPARMLLPAAGKYKPREKSGHTAKERKQAAIEAHLLKMESIIKKNKEQKESTSAGDTTPGAHNNARLNAASPLSRRASQRQPLVRPPTPDYAAGHTADSQENEVEDAVRLLQKLLRGRAVQNMMFEGKERRAELIAELRAADEQLALQHRHEFALAQGSGNEAIDRVADAAKTRVEGEVVSEMLDFLSKELYRSREVAKMRAFVTKAAEQRHVREVEEGGRRQAEDLLREREDEVFRRVMQVHQETSRDFVDDMLEDVALEQSHSQALQELHVRSAGVDGLVLQLESELDSDENIVRELVASFLLPQVHRQHVRRQVTQEQRKYVTAAHALLTEMVTGMSQPKPNSSSSEATEDIL